MHTLNHRSLVREQSASRAATAGSTLMTRWMHARRRSSSLTCRIISSPTACRAVRPRRGRSCLNINRLAQATRTAGGTVIWIQTEALIADPQDWANRKGSDERRRMGKASVAFWPSPATDLAIYPTCAVLPEDKLATRVPLLGVHSVSIGTSMTYCAARHRHAAHHRRCHAARVASRPHVIMVSDRQRRPHGCAAQPHSGQVPGDLWRRPGDRRFAREVGG